MTQMTPMMKYGTKKYYKITVLISASTYLNGKPVDLKAFFRTFGIDFYHMYMTCQAFQEDVWTNE